MTIEQIEQKAEQINTLRWLESIADGYEDAADYIRKNAEYFTIEGVIYSCKGPCATPIQINPHRPISSTHLLDALIEAAAGIREEARALKAKIEGK